MRKNYTIIDLETTGFGKDARIIEICALRVIDGEIDHKFSTLINPLTSIAEEVTSVTGITNEMVSTAPTIDQAFGPFLNFIGNDVLLGYNIKTFDIPILERYADKLNYNFYKQFIDIYPDAKEKLHHLPNQKLSTVALFFKINIEGAHRAYKDCLITKEVYEKLENYTPDDAQVHHSGSSRNPKAQYTDQTKALQLLQALIIGILDDDKVSEDEIMLLKKWIDDNKELEGQYPYEPIKKELEKILEDGIIESHELDEMYTLLKSFIDPIGNTDSISDGSLKDKSCVLTGDFKTGSKSEIEALISKAGGQVKSGVSKKTDYVIVGSYGSDAWKCGNYGSKIKKAKELQSQGVPIQIISEDDFLLMLGE